MQDENERNYRMESEYVQSAAAGRWVCGRGKQQISYIPLTRPSRPCSKLRRCTSALGPPRICAVRDQQSSDSGGIVMTSL